MPLSLDSVTEEEKKTQTEKVDVDSMETHNPLAATARGQAFVAQVVAMTANNTRTLTSDEFSDLQGEYDKLEGFERFACATELGKIGITWLTTLEDEKDGYDDELNGYDVYAKICAASAEAATAPQG